MSVALEHRGSSGQLSMVLEVEVVGLGCHTRVLRSARGNPSPKVCIISKTGRYLSVVAS